MASRTGKSFDSYDDLHRYSTSDPAEFWSGLWDFAEVVGDKGEPPYLVDADKCRARASFRKPS
jgi:acetoacetyl-CoA synthetase